MAARLPDVPPGPCVVTGFLRASCCGHRRARLQPGCCPGATSSTFPTCHRPATCEGFGAMGFPQVPLRHERSVPHDGLRCGRSSQRCMQTATVRAGKAIGSLQSSSGCTQRRSGYPAKLRSALTHVAPCSIASAARNTSGIWFPLASILRQSSAKIVQCRYPGSTTTVEGDRCRTSRNSRATSRGLGCVKIRGWVTTRRNPLDTIAGMPKGSGPRSAASSHDRQASCWGDSGRCA